MRAVLLIGRFLPAAISPRFQVIAACSATPQTPAAGDSGAACLRSARRVRARWFFQSSISPMKVAVEVGIP